MVHFSHYMILSFLPRVSMRACVRACTWGEIRDRESNPIHTCSFLSCFTFFCIANTLRTHWENTEENEDRLNFQAVLMCLSPSTSSARINLPKRTSLPLPPATPALQDEILRSRHPRRDLRQRGEEETSVSSMFTDNSTEDDSISEDIRVAVNRLNKNDYF